MKRLLALLAAPFVCSLVLVFGTASSASAFGGPIGPVMVGDMLDSAAMEGVAFAGADVACAASVVCPAAMTIGVLGMAAWETHDTWVGFGKWAWDAIAGGGSSTATKGVSGEARCFGAPPGIPEFQITNVVAPPYNSTGTITVHASGCGNSSSTLWIDSYDYTCSSTPSTVRTVSGFTTWTVSAYGDGTLAQNTKTQTIGSMCTSGETETIKGLLYESSSQYRTYATWNGPPFSIPASSQSVTTIENCHDGSGVSQDQLLQSVAPFIEGGVAITPCQSLGSNWYPTKVTVTRSSTTDPNAPTVTSTETFPAPTGTPKPVPGTKGNVKTGYNPQGGTESDAPPDPANSYTPGNAPAPNRTPDDYGCLPSGWGMFNPIDWVYQPVKCVVEWAFDPRAVVMPSWSPDLTQLEKYEPPVKSLADPGAQGCGGFTGHLDVNVGPVLSGSDFDFADTCQDPWKSAAHVTYAAATVFIIVWAMYAVWNTLTGALGLRPYSMGSFGASDNYSSEDSGLW